MKERNIKHEKRLKKLVLTCLLLAVVLTVGTYAWFIGMQTVAVNAFEVEIAAVDDLSLSLDGETWSTDLTVNDDRLSKNAYAKNTYRWTDLKPVSTIGEISASTSKLVMYDKGSLTATAGGYRLMSALVQNKAATGTSSGEEDGYVAFDLFIKNMSGDAYYSDITDPSNEEAIYLSTDSEVTGKNSGDTETGIENSVRIAFAQIGRTRSDAEKSLIQSISCATAEGITTICDKRLATIYEPNDKAHVTDAITWYQNTCKLRTGGTYTTTSCHLFEDEDGNKPYDLKDGVYFPTYAVSGVIDDTSAVDVYDGINNYNGTVKTVSDKGKNTLVAIDTFTDTEKNLNGVDRPTFFTLAPNSVTKVRVYVYLEGQDIDNYDFASLGYSITAKFGFTKERFTGDDIGGSDLQSDVDSYNNNNAVADTYEEPTGE